MNKKYLFLITLFLIIILLVTLVDLKSLWEMALIWVEKLGFWGYLLFIFLYNIGTLLFIPGSILTIKGGCLYGLLLGTILVSISALLGAIICFLLGRYYCRNWVYQQLTKYPLLQKLDRVVAEEGWKIVFLSRLSPLFPFNLLNYFFGITQISLKDYIIGSLAILPGTVMYVYIGSLARDIVTFEPSNYGDIPETQGLIRMMHLCGLIATIAITIYTIQIAQKTIKQKDIFKGD
jgi:uncharacterized membrane protein YdjX (TVP38/TMEM64 family)